MSKTIINPDKFKYLPFELPYYVASQKPFALETSVLAFQVNHGGNNKRVIMEDEQIDGFNTFIRGVDSIGSRYEPHNGLTLCIAGDVHYGMAETVAAYLANSAGPSKISIWVHAAEVVKASALRYSELPSIAGTSQVPNLAIITGLAWNAPDFRWVMASDLMRSLPARCFKVVVGVGADPSQVMKRLYLPFHKALNLSRAGHVVDMT